VLLPLPADARKIIVAPLNWGLGHATRSIPIIRQLLSDGKEVVIASDGEALELLQEEFPELITEKLPSYEVTYKGNSLVSIVLSNVPNIISAILREKKAVKKLVKKYKADLIISDSRFGFRSSKIKSIIISHQLNLMSKNKILKYFLNLANGYFLNSFEECWVPDDESHTWSGNLSKSKRIKNQVFLGPLSRLNREYETQPGQSYELCIILSGPEPARTKLETELIDSLLYGNLYKQLKPTSTADQATPRIFLIRGTTRHGKLQLPANWTVMARANSDRINSLLLGSELIISRSGYTSIMDYAELGVGAWLIPTPGQSEQEYLAKWLTGKSGMQKLEL